MAIAQVLGAGVAAVLIAAAGCPKTDTESSGSTSGQGEQGGDASGSSGAGDSGAASSGATDTSASGTTTTATGATRLVSPDGRLQAVDAAGNPLFDAAGNPMWEESPRDKARRLFDDAVAYRKGSGPGTGNPQACADSLREATSLHPSFAEAWYDLGLCQLDLNLLPEAGKSLAEAARLRADFPDAWTSLGIAYERDGKLNDALRAYTSGLQKSPQDVGLLNGVVRVYRKQGRPDLAIQKALEILRINSNSLEAYNSLGLAYRDQREFELARFVLMKAENSVPGGSTSGAIQNNLGLVYFDMGDEFQAEARFTRARQLDPKDVGAMVNLAHLRLKNLDFVGARELLEEAHRVLPASIPIQLNLAVARRGTGDLDGARRVYEEIAAGGGEYEDDALLNLGILYGDFIKDYAQAIDSYNAYISTRQRQGQAAAADDPVHEYIKEAEKILAREEKKKQQKGAQPAGAGAAPAPEAPGAAP